MRVSTVRQAAGGESLNVQQRTIAGYALMRDRAIDQVFIERAVSGSVPLSERLQGAALLALVQPGDEIITPKLDRMFRSALDALDVLSRLRDRSVALQALLLSQHVAGERATRRPAVRKHLLC